MRMLCLPKWTEYGNRMTEMARKITEAGSKVRVLIVDDHTLLAETLSTMLSRIPDLEVEYVSGVAGALKRIEDDGRFGVVLLDYDLPGVKSLSGLRSLIDANGGNVVLFSGVANWTVVDRAIEEGASGFIPKTTHLKILVHAIRIIADGEVYLPADYMRQASRDAGESMGLKPREFKVLTYLAQGLQNKEIGRELGIEETIVKMDVKSISRKVNASNRTQAVLNALKLGLI